MASRINLGKAVPSLYQAMIGLDKGLSDALTSANVTAGFAHLLRLRASQINECAFCIRLHAKDALAQGVSADRIAVLPAWRETQYFTDKERAALALVEAITLVADDQVPDAIYDAAAEQLSAEELAAIEWLAVVINAWNRIGVASRYRVAP